MKNIYLSSENINSVARKINEIVNGKTYWLGLGYGDYKSVDDPHFRDRWFSGAGTFDRLLFMTARVDSTRSKIILQHKNAVDKKNVTPELFEITHDLKISTDKNDLLIFNKSKLISHVGGTTMYMEYSHERVKKYLYKE